MRDRARETNEAEKADPYPDDQSATEKIARCMEARGIAGRMYQGVVTMVGTMGASARLGSLCVRSVGTRGISAGITRSLWSYNSNAISLGTSIWISRIGPNSMLWIIHLSH